MARIVMAYVIMADHGEAGVVRPTQPVYNYGLYSYGVYSYGIYNRGPYSYGVYVHCPI